MSFKILVASLIPIFLIACAGLEPAQKIAPITLNQNLSPRENESDGSCHSGFGYVPNGGAITGYRTTMSMPGFPCATVVATCNNGSLSEPNLYSSCSDIMQDCSGIPNGGSSSGFSSPFAPCVPTTVTCTNGLLSGPMPYPSCN